MIPGKFVVLKAPNCGLCVSTEGNSDKENCRAVLSEAVAGEDHQVWYYDVSSCTIRCKANDLCLTTQSDSTLKLTTYHPDQQSVQAMCFESDKIVLKNSTRRAVKAHEKVCGSILCLGDCCSSDTCWQITYLELKLYHLEASNGLVLSTEGEVRESGTHVVLAKKQPLGRPYHQLWYEDEHANLKCSHNHFVLDASHKEVTLEHDEKKPEQQWMLYGSTVSLRYDISKWLTALDPGMGVGSRVGVDKRADSAQQKWNRVYID